MLIQHFSYCDNEDGKIKMSIQEWMLHEAFGLTGALNNIAEAPAGYCYLATPYSNYYAGKQLAYEAALEISAALTCNDVLVYSPIVHFHTIAGIAQLPTDAEFWKEANHNMLKHAVRLIVPRMVGWDKSAGVKAEIEFADKIGTPIVYLPVYGL